MLSCFRCIFTFLLGQFLSIPIQLHVFLVVAMYSHYNRTCECTIANIEIVFVVVGAIILCLAADGWCLAVLDNRGYQTSW